MATSSKEYLSQFRNQYFIGNYGKVMELWNASTDENYGEYAQQIDFIVARSLIAQKFLQAQAVVAPARKPSQQLLAVTDVVNKFLTPVLMQHPGTLEKEKADYVQLFQSFRDVLERSKASYVHTVTALHLAITAQNYEFVASYKPDAPLDKNIEILFLQAVNLLRANRPDLAQRKVLEMKVIDDEDILTLLAQVYLNLGEQKYQQALAFLDEVKERYGESSKLLNIRVSVLTLQKNFEEAYNIASKVYQVLTTKEKLFDKQEMETCLNNLLVLGEILRRPNDEYRNALRALNEKANFLRQYAESERIFNELSEKHSQKN